MCIKDTLSLQFLYYYHKHENVYSNVYEKAIRKYWEGTKWISVYDQWISD